MAFSSPSIDSKIAENPPRTRGAFAFLSLGSFSLSALRLRPVTVFPPPPARCACGADISIGDVDVLPFAPFTSAPALAAGSGEKRPVRWKGEMSDADGVTSGLRCAAATATDGPLPTCGVCTRVLTRARARLLDCARFAAAQR